MVATTLKPKPGRPNAAAGPGPVEGPALGQSLNGAHDNLVPANTAAPAPAPAEMAKPSPRPRRARKIVLLTLLAAGLAAGVFSGIRWYIDSLSYVSTDDAFIDGHLERVAPQIAGRVLRLAVQDNQEVKAGDLLLEIDPADYKAAEAAAAAQLASAKAEIEQAKAQRALADAQVTSAQADQRVADAQVTQAQASVQSAQATADNAAASARRYEGLEVGQRGAISQQ